MENCTNGGGKNKLKYPTGKFPVPLLENFQYPTGKFPVPPPFNKILQKLENKETHKKWKNFPFLYIILYILLLFTIYIIYNII